jgi:hypothetical protein
MFRLLSLSPSGGGGLATGLGKDAGTSIFDALLSLHPASVKIVRAAIMAAAFLILLILEVIPTVLVLFKNINSMAFSLWVQDLFANIFAVIDEKGCVSDSSWRIRGLFLIRSEIKYHETDG